MTLSRRDFVSGFGTGLAAISVFELIPPSAGAQLVYQRSDWNFAEFDKLVHVTATVKQLFDVRAIGEGRFLNNVKNSLNGLHYGFGIPNDQIKIVVALHGPANALAFDDSMWLKYRLGEFFEVNDPSTGKPAIRNIFYPMMAKGSHDVQDPSSKEQDHGIEALQQRGVKFLSCHTATEEQVSVMVRKFSLTSPKEDIVKDLQAHVIPDLLIVPAMVATVALLQSEGHFTYITV